MKINSAAGEFEFDVTSMELEGKDIVLIGKMGVWEARTVVPQDELTRILALLFRSRAFWKLSPRLPGMLIKAGFGRHSPTPTENTHV